MPGSQLDIRKEISGANARKFKFRQVMKKNSDVNVGFVDFDRNNCLTPGRPSKNFARKLLATGNSDTDSEARKSTIKLSSRKGSQEMKQDTSESRKCHLPGIKQKWKPGNI